MSTKVYDMKEEESKADQRKQEVQITDSGTLVGYPGFRTLRMFLTVD
jgi:hypothetical protein